MAGARDAGRAVRRGAGAVAARARRPTRRPGRRPQRRAGSSARRRRRACSRSSRRWASRRCRSYCGAQIFEVLGLGHEVIGACFAGTASPHRRHRLRGDRRGRAGAPSRGLPPRRRPTTVALPDHGRVRFRKDGEDHGWAPPVVVALQQAVKAGDADGVRRLPGQERQPAAGGPARPARRCAPGTPVPLEEVETAEAIRTRFVSSAMSLGALSPEAHATLVHRDEPDGRPLELGRGRRGSAQLSRLRQRRPGRQPDQAGGLAPGSASPPSTWSAPRSWRSRSSRAPSRAKAASSRRTR